MTLDEQINTLAAKQTNDIQALGVVTFEQASANAVFDARRTALLLAVRGREGEIQALMVQRANQAAMRMAGQMAQQAASAEIHAAAQAATKAAATEADTSASAPQEG
jgi:hypothetical protein